MNAKPHLNGNSPETFLNSGERLHTIAVTTKKQTRDALSEITHGRNYQHTPHHEMGRISDLARIAKIIEALDDLASIGIELHDIGSTG